MSVPSAELGYQLRLACMRLTRRVRNGTQSLAPHFFSVLSLLEHECATAAELSAKERVSAPSMSRTIAELTDRGFVAKCQSEKDKRCTMLNITDAGLEALSQGRKERDEWMDAHLKDCSEEELQILTRATEIIDELCRR